MERKSTTKPYFNTLGQVSGHACMESKLPWLIPDSDSPGLGSLKPASEATQFLGAYKETISERSQYFQLSSSNSVPKCSLPAVETEETEATYIYTENLAGLYTDYKTPLTENVTVLPIGRCSKPQNSGFAEILTQVQFYDGFQVQTSEACHRTCMSNQNENRKDFIFNPVLVPDFSSSLPDRINIREENSVQNLEHQRETLAKLPYLDSLGRLDAKFPWYRETVPPAIATFPKVRMSKFCLTALDRCGGEFIDCPVGKNENSSHVSWNVLSQPSHGDSHSQYQSHENTEDIEALLSSDEEESSTGHSPSTYNRSNEKMQTDGSAELCTEHLSNKRSNDQQACIEEEFYFGPATAEESVGESDMNDICCFFDDSPLVATCWETSCPTKHCKNVMDAESDEKKVRPLSTLSMFTESSKNSAIKYRESLKSLSKQSDSTKKSRKERIKGRVGLLRNIISGGNNMGTAILLGKTIQYVKSLEAKLKILEANRHKHL